MKGDEAGPTGSATICFALPFSFTESNRAAFYRGRRRWKMRKAIMIAGLILAVGVLAPAGALGKAGGTDRPIKDTESGTTALDLGSLTFSNDVTGNTSHLGRTTTHLDAALTLTGPDTFTLAGSGTIVAANGSELFVTFTGSGTLEASGNTGGPVVLTITGGTGRFDGASGSLAGSYSQVLESMNATTANYATDYSLNGTISY